MANGKRYEGEGAYELVKVLSALSVVGGGIGAVVLWANSSQPTATIDILGNPTITKTTDPTLVVAGVIVLLEGLFSAAVLWALGTMGEHIVALRRWADGGTTPVMGPQSTNIPAVVPPTPGSTSVPSSSPQADLYDVVVVSAGDSGEKVAKVARIVADETGEHVTQVLDRLVELPAVVLHRVGFATAEGSRRAMVRAGAEVEVRPLSPDEPRADPPGG